MLINTQNLCEPIEFTIKGDEPELLEILEQASMPGQSKLAKLSGILGVYPVNAGVMISVNGTLTGEIPLPCSRCGEIVHFPIESKVNVLYKETPDISAHKKERALSKDELDEYYLDSEKNLNFSELVNDIVMTSLPSQVTPDLPELSKNGANLHTCITLSEDDRAYGSSPEKENEMSPFGVLKDYIVKS